MVILRFIFWGLLLRRGLTRSPKILLRITSITVSIKISIAFFY